jgi:hypothetical protein
MIRPGGQAGQSLVAQACAEPVEQGRPGIVAIGAAEQISLGGRCWLVLSAFSDQGIDGASQAQPVELQSDQFQQAFTIESRPGPGRYRNGSGGPPSSRIQDKQHTGQTLVADFKPASQVIQGALKTNIRAWLAAVATGSSRRNEKCSAGCQLASGVSMAAMQLVQVTVQPGTETACPVGGRQAHQVADGPQAATVEGRCLSRRQDQSSRASSASCRTSASELADAPVQPGQQAGRCGYRRQTDAGMQTLIDRSLRSLSSSGSIPPRRRRLPPTSSSTVSGGASTTWWLC